MTDPAQPLELDRPHSYPRQWADFWRVWWHCLTRGVLRLDGKHRMYELGRARKWIGTRQKYHFCNCGFLWEHVPKNVSLEICR